MNTTGTAGFGPRYLVCALVLALFYPGTAAAGPLSAAGLQGALLGSASECGSVKAEVEISITLPDWPGVEPIVFSDELEISYSRNGDSIMVMTDQFGPLDSPLESIPDNFKPVTLELKLANSAIKVTRDEGGETCVSAVDIDVSAFKSGEKIATFAIKDISFDEVDVSDGSAYLMFDAVLPKAGHELFDQFLAGKRIEGEVTVRF